MHLNGGEGYRKNYLIFTDKNGKKKKNPQKKKDNEKKR